MSPLLPLGLLLALSAPPAPAALVLQADSAATLVRDKAAPRPLRDLDLLLPGDRIQAGKAALRLVVLSDGHSERVLAGKEATVQAAGCQPAASVEHERGKLSAGQVARLRKLARSGLGAVLVVRGLQGTPLQGSTIQNRRPTLSWSAVPGATSYDVRLFDPDLGLEWKASTRAPSLKYPAKQSDLPWGAACSWEVVAHLKDGKPKLVLESKFNVIEEEAQPVLAGLKPMVAGDDPAGWLLAAAVFEAHGVYEEAFPLYEKYNAKRPDQPRILRILGAYYLRLGSKDKATAAFDRARKLEAGPPSR
jgi:hypothetical protein